MLLWNPLLKCGTRDLLHAPFFSRIYYILALDSGLHQTAYYGYNDFEKWFRIVRVNTPYERNIGQEMNVSMINRTFYLKFHHQLMSQMWRSFLCIRSTAENNWFFPVNFNSLTSIHPKNGSNLSSQRGKNILHTINLFPVFSFYFNHHHCVRW